MDRDRQALFPSEIERHLIARARVPRRINFTTLFRRLTERRVVAMRPAQQIVSGDGTLGDDGVLTFPVSSAVRHHPRRIRLCGFDGVSSAFWVNLVIAGGQAVDMPASQMAAAKGRPLSKAYGPLSNSVRDLDALRDFFQPTRIGEVEHIYPNSYLRSHGYFSHTVWLGAPDRAALDEGVASIAHWLALNGGDPEFESFRLNIYYSGHGSPGTGSGDSRLVLGDDELRTSDLVAALVDAFVAHRVFADQGIIALSFDCCHAGALIRDFVVALRDVQARASTLGVNNLACGELYASSLDDEQSFDEEGLGNSYFTAGYLRENSAVPAPANYPALWQTPLRSGGEQHPLFIRIEPGGKAIIRFPALSLLTDAEQTQISANLQEAAFRRAITRKLVNSEGVLEQMDFYMCKAAVMRDACRALAAGRTAPESPVVGFEDRITQWG